MTEYTGACGSSHAIGDTVTAHGYEGTWTVKAFAHDYRSSSQGEMHTALVFEDGRTQLFYPSYLVKKA